MYIKKTICFVFSLIFLISTVFSVNAEGVKNTVVCPEPVFKCVTENLTSVTVWWQKAKKVKGYIIERSEDRVNWKRIKTYNNRKTTYHIDYTVKQDTVYYYSVRAFKKVNGKKYYSKRNVIKQVFFGTNFYISTYPDYVATKWQPLRAATGYEIYFSTDMVNFKRIKHIKKNTRGYYNKKKLDTANNRYAFYMKAYNMLKGKKNYIYQSDIMYSDDKMAVLNGSVTTPKNSFDCINTQGKKEKLSYTVSVSNKDMAIINNYNKMYITDDMSPYYKVKTVFFDIHKNVKYATGSLYSQIDGCSYAEAIFTHKLGQCAQYNGAMAEYLTTLGLDCKLIYGYRGKSNTNKWQHFWGEVTLSDGITYVVETGNNGQDKGWYYFLEPYLNTKKYLKCGKYISGIKA